MVALIALECSMLAGALLKSGWYREECAVSPFFHCALDPRCSICIELAPSCAAVRKPDLSKPQIRRDRP